MITGYILGDRELVRRLEAMPVAAKARIDATVVALGYELENRVKTNYLRGPRPIHLGVRTGHLLASITHGSADSRSRFESTPEKSIYYVGTNVEYGALWEFGFNRRIGAGARGGPRTLTGQALATYIAKHPPGTRAMAGRPFLRPALDDMRAKIVEKLAAVLKESMQQAVKR